MNIEVILQIVAILLGIGGAGLAWREFFYLPQKARQDVLDRLREPAVNGLNWVGDTERSWQERTDAVVKNGMDASDLRARFSCPDRHLWKAVQRLYSENRIDVFLLRGIEARGAHRDVPAGTEVQVPIFVRGMLPPDLRPERPEVKTLLRRLRS